MVETLTLRSERVDDMPLLLAQVDRMGLQSLLDEHVPTHGHWVGLSLGWVTVLWLTHILSEAEHRLNHVQPWAGQRLHTRRGATGPPVHPLDLSDDRLAAVLEALSDEARWPAFAGAFTHHLVRVYDLQAERVRLDATTASGYWRVSEDGLLQFGHRQEHRPDLPQVNVLLSVLDPLGLPVATDVVPGQRADEPLSLPAVTRVRESLGRRGRLSVGDGKMGALETRAALQAGGDFYLCPWSERQGPPAVVAAQLAPGWTGEQRLPPVYRGQANGEPTGIAEGLERLEPLTAVGAGVPSGWTERRLVVRSSQLAQAGERGLRGRLANAPVAMAALNARRRGKRRMTEWPALQAEVAALLARSHVQGLWPVHQSAQARWQSVRRAGDRPARLRMARDWQVLVRVDEEAVGAAVRPLGGRGSATTAPPEQLSRTQAVLAYRSPYVVESDIARLTGHPWSLTPMSLERDDHVTGVIRLLSLALRVLTLGECVVRQRLAAAGTVLAGVQAGNPKRATARPAPERLLKNFEGLTLTIIRAGRRRRSHLTPLSRVHRRILALLNFPVDISTRLCPDAYKPP